MRLSELAYDAFSPDPNIVGITADSREIGPGFLFAALPGVVADGANFIPQAEENGASAILAMPGVKTAVPTIHDANPRRRLAQLAARFYPRQPETIAGITGTNGKTSTAFFTSQIWSMLGENAGSLGTLGAQSKAFSRPLEHTTPDPVRLHETLDAMTRLGVTHLAIEVSSHGLAQARADAVEFSVAAFTNITQDHLDYHESFDDYFSAKARLFDTLLKPNGTVVINMDGEGAENISEIARARGLPTVKTGVKGRDIRLLQCTPHLSGLVLDVEILGKKYNLDIPLIGGFQAENVLLAAGIAIASGARIDEVVPALEKIKGARGRMEQATEVAGAGIFVDYAHTPDAVATALQAIRPHAKGRVVAVIGAGGDRDQLKRPLMGAAAHEYADMVIVTDDNPRSEDPSAIRADVIMGCPDAQEIGDREQAIATGVAALKEGDVLLIMGKGHETGQKVGETLLPFDDAEVAQSAVANRLKELGR